MSGKGGKPRQYPGVTGRRPDNKVSRKETARINSEMRGQLTAFGQLAKLDAVLGTGVGAKRERARLARAS